MKTDKIKDLKASDYFLDVTGEERVKALEQKIDELEKECEEYLDMALEKQGERDEAQELTKSIISSLNSALARAGARLDYSALLVKYPWLKEKVK